MGRPLAIPALLLLSCCLSLFSCEDEPCEDQCLDRDDDCREGCDDGDTQCHSICDEKLRSCLYGCDQG